MTIASFPVISGIVAGSAAFWIAYRLLAYRRPLHGMSRAFLLLGLTVPVLLSIVQHFLPAAAEKYTLSYALPEFVVGQSAVAISELPFKAGFAICYLLVAAVLLFRNLIGVARLRRRCKASPVGDYGGIRIYTNTDTGPGSLGKTIFFPDSEVDSRILMHETGHVRLGHHYDLALANLISCLLWMNPFAWILRRELRLVHEFQADAFALSASESRDTYAHLLLRQSFRTPSPAFTHAFFHHPIKQRIAMLFAKQSSGPQRAARMFSAGIAAAFISAALLFVQCSSEKANTPQPERPSKAMKNPSTGIYTYTDEMPAFNGDLNNYLVSELKYPDAARNANVEGRAVVQFIVTDAGIVKGAEIVRSSGSEVLDAEALRAVNAMPAWKPGKDGGKPVNVYFTLPVTFMLDDAPATGTPGVSGVFKAEECAYEEYVTFRSDALRCSAPLE